MMDRGNEPEFNLLVSPHHRSEGENSEHLMYEGRGRTGSRKRVNDALLSGR